MLGLFNDDTNPWMDGFSLLGWGSNGKFLMGQTKYPNLINQWRDPALKTYDGNDSWRQAHLFGKSGNIDPGIDFCADGTSVNSCTAYVHYNLPRAEYDSVDNKWLVSTGSGDVTGMTKLRMVLDNIDNNATPRTMQTFVTLPRAFNSFTYWRTGGHEYVYYCGDNGRIYRYDVTTSLEVELPLPSSTVKCLRQHSLVLDRTNAILYFNFESNKLHAIGSVDAI